MIDRDYLDVVPMTVRAHYEQAAAVLELAHDKVSQGWRASDQADPSLRFFTDGAATPITDAAMQLNVHPVVCRMATEIFAKRRRRAKYVLMAYWRARQDALRAAEVTTELR